MWMGKISLGSRALTKAQNNVGLNSHKMLTPIKKRWIYLISLLHCLIEDSAAINYMYGTLEGVGSKIKKLHPKWMD